MATNEKIYEEVLIKAYKKGIGKQVKSLASTMQDEDPLDALVKAYNIERVKQIMHLIDPKKAQF